jgi:hypothetical protein
MLDALAQQTVTVTVHGGDVSGGHSVLLSVRSKEECTT